MTQHNVLFPKSMRLAFFAVIFSALAVSCEKEYDSPPLRTLPIGSVLTVAELRDLYTNADVRFRGDSSVYAVVTADEQNGNLYKNIFVQDHTGAIVAQADDHAETVITAEFDLEAVRRYRQSWGVFRDRRPDLYGPLLELGRTPDASR